MSQLKWYKIPGFARYEIRDDLAIRDVRTSRELKKRDDRRARLFGDDGGIRCLTCSTWLRLAKLAVADDAGWIPIMGFSRYEMLSNGTVRNRKTKLPLKTRAHDCYSLKGDDGKNYTRSKNHLLLLMSGRKKRGSCLRVPVVIEKGRRRLYFDYMYEAFEFISRQFGYHWRWASNRYYLRKEREIGGWRIKKQL